MKRILFFLFASFCLSACSDKKQAENYPVIDVVGCIGKYQKVYCSDLFSSIELIPLETRDECLLDVPGYLFSSGVIMNNDLILVSYTSNNDDKLYSFDRTGKFLKQIGRRGQGPGEYHSFFSFSFSSDNSSIYLFCANSKILEFDVNGKFIHSLTIPKIEGKELGRSSYAGNNLFVGHRQYTGENKYNYCLYDRDGNIAKCFPNHIFFNRVDKRRSISYDFTLYPVRVDDRMYLKEYVNDTIYCLINSFMQPAFVFELGKYHYPKEFLELPTSIPEVLKNVILTRFLIGTPNYFFYVLSIPDILPVPKIQPVLMLGSGNYKTRERDVFGIYNIEDNTNILLDINENLLSEKGIINDMNGGLSFFPRYYAGNNVVVDLWDAEKMKETLTDDYFASKTIKDPDAHQKLKEILKNLKFDDNPVVVVAKLK